MPLPTKGRQPLPCVHNYVEKHERPIISLDRNVMVVIALVCVCLHGCFMFNSVGFHLYWMSDENLSRQNDEHVGLFNKTTAFYCVADGFAGALLTQLMDIIGPRRQSLMGHILMFAGWSLYQLPVEYSYIWLPVSSVLQGCGLQPLVNPCMLMGNLFTTQKPMIINLIGGSIDFSLFIPLIMLKLHNVFDYQQMALIMMSFVVLTATIVYLTFPNCNEMNYEIDKSRDHGTSQAIDNQDLNISLLCCNEENLQERITPLLLSIQEGSNEYYDLLDDVEDCVDSEEVSIWDVLLTVDYISFWVFGAVLVAVFQLQTAFVMDTTLYLPPDRMFEVQKLFTLLGPVGAFTCFGMGQIASVYGVLKVYHLNVILSMLTNICFYIDTPISMYIGIISYTCYKSCLACMCLTFCIQYFPASVTARCYSWPVASGALLFLCLFKGTSKIMVDTPDGESFYENRRSVLSKLWLCCIAANIFLEILYQKFLKGRKPIKDGKTVIVPKLK